MAFKQALASQYGVEAGFEIYKSMMELPVTASLELKPVRSLREFSMNRGDGYTEVHPSGEIFSIDPPEIVGDSDCETLGRAARSFYTCSLPDARIQANSAIVEVDGSVLIDFEGGELEHIDDRFELDPRIFCATKSTAWVIEGQRSGAVWLDEAFGSLMGPHTAAFGHWLEEYLPKFLAATSAGALPRMPLLIDADMPSNHREILEFILPYRAEIIELEPGTTARVSRLWCAPALRQYPFLAQAGISENFFVTPPSRFQPVIAQMRGSARDLEPTGVDRLFLSRKSDLRRKLVNIDAIEVIAESRGFAIFCPEDHSFEEQVRFVRHARFVAGAEGSSMYLTFFAPPGTRLCILNHPVTAHMMWYTAYLKEAGIDVTIITGPILRPNVFPGYPNFGFKHFADYEIDETRFSSFLDRWLASA